MIKLSILLKIVCTVMFLICVTLNLVSIVTYWRNAHSQFNEKFLPLLPPEDRVDNSKHPDIILMKFGIVKNCKIHNVDDCPWPVKQGFVGDTALVAMLSITLVLHIINFLVMLLSTVHPAFPPKILYILSLTCFIATTLMIVGVVVFGVYYDTYYFDLKTDISNEVGFNEVKKEFAKINVGLHDDWISVPFPYTISFAEAFFITIVAIGFGFLTTVAVGCAAFESEHDENQNVVKSTQKYQSQQDQVFSQPPPPPASAQPHKQQQAHPPQSHAPTPQPYQIQSQPTQGYPRPPQYQKRKQKRQPAQTSKSSSKSKPVHTRSPSESA